MLFIIFGVSDVIHDVIGTFGVVIVIVGLVRQNDVTRLGREGGRPDGGHGGGGRAGTPGTTRVRGGHEGERRLGGVGRREAGGGLTLVGALDTRGGRVGYLGLADVGD